MQYRVSVRGKTVREGDQWTKAFDLGGETTLEKVGQTDTDPREKKTGGIGFC